MKILVRAANWIGDAVLSLPALRAIRQRYLGAQVHVLARPWVGGLYDQEGAVDRIIALEGSPGTRDFRIKARIAGLLRREKYDLSLLFPNSFESAVIPYLAGIPERIGYARDGRSPLLTLAPDPPRPGQIPRHERYYYLELLRRAGIVDAIPEAPEIRFDRADEAGSRGAALFREHGLGPDVIGVSPGAAYGGAKRWLADRFAESAARLARESGARIAVFGSAAERDLCASVAARANGRNFAGQTTLRQFMDMTAACRLFLSNDSGAMHIASALGIPTITIFGPTDEYATGPTGSRAIIVREPVPCAPCLLRECPIDHRCMTSVAVDRVVSIAQALLNR